MAFINSSFQNSLPLPLKLQFPIMPLDTGRYGCNPDFYLIESTVYLFQPLHDGTSINNNNPSSSRGWLVKFIQTVDGKLTLVNPLNNKTIQVLQEDVPNNVLNLLDLHVSQVCKSYHVQYFNKDHDLGRHPASKILLNSTNDRAWSSTGTNNYFSLMAIHIRGHLCYIKSGDEKWTKLKDRSCKIVDIIVYKGNFYAVDRYGETIKFDSLLNETKVASMLHNIGGRKKRLVESSGQLFLIDMFLDVDHDRYPEFRHVIGHSGGKALKIKMYRLDEQQHEWTEVHTLGDRIFFAGDDCCFSVSSKDFGDGRGNCLYYTNGGIRMEILGKYGDRGSDHLFNESGDKYGDHLSQKLVHKYKGLHGHNTGVFTIEDGKLGSLLSFLEYADIFWPPPSWLNREDQGI
ncbi:F-box protein SKIP23-like [Lycium barbarum]|uniref:F-box protein SKIP23-like n=1 Tax=Lycium barbarum TaxID=112863 RepID=UPI00293F06AF|nr:F-box protein SKIP23-like [Lycium barbarum]